MLIGNHGTTFRVRRAIRLIDKRWPIALITVATRAGGQISRKPATCSPLERQQHKTLFLHNSFDSVSVSDLPWSLTSRERLRRRMLEYIKLPASMKNESVNEMHERGMLPPLKTIELYIN